MDSGKFTDIPEELIEAGADKRLTVFVGAGASMSAGLPGWDRLLKSLLEAAKRDSIDATQKEAIEEADNKVCELPLKASILCNVMGDGWVRDHIVEEIKEKNKHAKPSDIHRILAALQNVRFVTTNYDKLLEIALEEEVGRKPHIFTVEDTESISRFNSGEILKLHGDIDRPSTLVLSVRDYKHVGYEVPPAWKERLKSLLQNSRLIFVCYGYRDPDIYAVVNELQAAYNDSLAGPWWLTESSAANQALARDSGLRLIEVDSIDEIVPWLRELQRLVNKRRDARANVQVVDGYVKFTLDVFEKKNKEVQKDLDEGRYQDADRKATEMLHEAEKQLGIDPERKELVHLVSQTKLRAAQCRLCLQEIQEAGELAMEVDSKTLNDEPKLLAHLANILVEIGEIESAKMIFDRLEGFTVSDSEGDEIPTKDLEFIKTTRQLLALAEGVLPKDLSANPILLTKASRILFDQGKLEEAAEKAMAAYSLDKKSVLVATNILVTLVLCLQQTILEHPPAENIIPLEKRKRVVACIEELIAMLGARTLPPKVENLFWLWSTMYFHLSWDWERVDQAREKVPEELVNVTEEEKYRKAHEFAAAGNVQKAFEFLPKWSHPWINQLRRAELLIEADRCYDAVQILEPLSENWPGRALIHYHTARALRSLNRPKDALEHAQKALDGLPGRGAGLLVAMLLIDVGENIQYAWELLEPFAESEDFNAMLARACAARLLNRRDTEELYRKLLSVYPDDWRRHLELATLFWRQGLYKKGADEAYAVFQRFGENNLDIQGVGLCAQLQQIGDKESLEDVNVRIRRIMAVLKDRFSGIPEAEKFYMRLYLWLGSPADLEPPKYQKLEESGSLTVVSIKNLMEMWREEAQIEEALWKLYSIGLIPFDCLSKFLSIPSPRVFHDLTRQNKEVFLSTPIRSGLTQPLSLNGMHLLMGELELFLLQKFNVFSGLREALGDSGGVFIFEDVRKQLAENAASLGLTAQSSGFEEIGSLERNLTNHPKVRWDKDIPQRSDVDSALELEKAIVHHERPKNEVKWIHPLSVVRWMNAHGHVDNQKAEFARRLFLNEGEEIQQLPSELMMTRVSLFHLNKAGVLFPLLEVIEGKLHIGPETVFHIQQEIERLSVGVNVAKLAQSLHREVEAGLRAGWISTISRPKVVYLPKPSELFDESNADNKKKRMVYEIVSHCLSLREAIRERSDLLLITADYLVSALFIEASPKIFAQILRWPRKIYENIIGKVRDVAHRELYFTDVLEPACPERRRSEIRRQLVEMGFQSALRPEDIHGMAKRYNSLEGAKPKHFLDAAEWIAVNSEHLGHNVANLCLSRVYGKAVWEAWVNTHETSRKAREKRDRVKELDILNQSLNETELNSLTDNILNRVESIDNRTDAGVLDNLFFYIAVEAVASPFVSFGPTEDKDLFKMDSESPPAKLWRNIQSWTGPSGRRRSALERSLVDILVTLHKRVASGDNRVVSKEPHFFTIAPILHAIPLDPGVPFANPAIAALGILSSESTNEVLKNIEIAIRHEESSTLHKMTLLTLLEKAVGAAKTLDFVFDANAFTWVFSLPIDNAGSNRIRVGVPPEAVIARSSPDHVSTTARILSRQIGMLDGNVAELLNKLSEAPCDKIIINDFRLAAASAPWRRIRHDPAQIRRWRLPGPFMMGGTCSFDDIRNILSEPDRLPGDDIKKMLVDRVKKGGLWHDREDGMVLFIIACEIPGVLAVLPIEFLLGHSNSEEEVQDALARLHYSEQQPAGRLFRDIVFLRLAASRHPIVKTQNGTIDLREILSERLVDIIQKEISRTPRAHSDGDLDSENSSNKQYDPSKQKPSITNTLADAESDILRLCFEIVPPMAKDGGFLDAKERLWLTYRLYQWLINQIDALSHDRRVACLQELRAFAPPQKTSEECLEDVLDPNRFAPDRFDYRLASVLLAFTMMELVDPFSVGKKHSENNKEQSWSFTSEGIEEILLSMAAWKETEVEKRLRRVGKNPSALGWNGPTSVPELAIFALMHLNTDAFLKLRPVVRLRWFKQVLRKNEPGKTDVGYSLFLKKVFLFIIGKHCEKLSPDEIEALRPRVLNAADSDDNDLAGLFATIGLLRSGQGDVEHKVNQILKKNLKHPMAPQILGHLLSVLSFVNSDKMVDIWQRYLDLADSFSMDIVPFVLSMATVIFRGNPEKNDVALDALGKMIGSENLLGDERVNNMVSLLGLPTEDAAR